jgi:hypothetical protein
MKLNQESLKFRADLLKYLGIVFCVPLGTSLLLLLTDINYALPMRFFLISLPLALLGVKCIYHGIWIKAGRLNPKDSFLKNLWNAILP